MTLPLFIANGITGVRDMGGELDVLQQFLGMENRLGTIKKGKMADLVLLNANPLDDIRNTQKIEAVIVNGRYLPRAELDKMLAGVEKAAQAQ